jgi:hypothetical protein
MREAAAFAVIVACVIIFVALKPGHDKQVIVEKPVIKEVPVTRTIIKEVPKVVEKKVPVAEPKLKSDDLEQSIRRLKEAQDRLKRAQERMERERQNWASPAPAPAPVQQKMVEPVYPPARPMMPLPRPYRYTPRPTPAYVVRSLENGPRYMPGRPPVYRYRTIPMGRPVYRYRFIHRFR